MWEEADELLLKDEYIAPLVETFGPCSIKPGLKKMYFEDLTASIVEQQLSGKAAKAIFARVKKLTKLHSPTPLYPISPADIRDTSAVSLRNCGISWSKVNYLKDLADKVERGVVNLKGIEKLSDEEVIAQLTKVKGIGRWTAEMFLMFSLARPDVFPLDDLGIQKGMQRLLAKNLTKAQKEEFSLRWKPYRTVASWYVWRVLDNKG